jgi:2-dehydro-3-deoxyphosphogluconate aldolase/(4S)-4-hydroxy-2-oxoglutarate aldolase
MDNTSAREEVIFLTRSTGILPAIKLKQKENLLPYVQAMYDGGARVVEITMTTPGVLDAFQAITAEFGKRLFLGAGTVLDPATARAAILAGAQLIVSPALLPEVIATAHRYGAACYSGAFTATECLTAMQAGADMIKVFPAALGGPKYMTNLRMVFPEINLIPSGGIGPENAAEFIQCGACAISGSRNFLDRAMVEKHGLKWVTEQIAQYIAIVARAKGSAHPLP